MSGVFGEGVDDFGEVGRVVVRMGEGLLEVERLERSGFMVWEDLLAHGSL